MTINPIEIMNSMVSIVKNIKTISGTIPANLFLPPNRSKIIKLQEQIDELEKMVYSGMPKLSQLVRFYARLISDVRIAGALSDKLAELYGMNLPLSNFTTLFINDLQQQYSRVSNQTSQFSYLDVAEKGSLERILTEIRDKIQDLRHTSTDDSKRIKEIMASISREYSDMESILSRLLEKILASFEIR